MKVLIPENSFLWTPKGFAFPHNLSEGSEIFVLDSNKKLIPIFIQNEINTKKLQVTTIITNVSIFTVPREFSLNNGQEKISVSKLKPEMKIDFVDEKNLNQFNQYFIDNIEKFSENFFNIVTARFMGKTFFNLDNRLPFLVPTDHANEEEARKLGKSLQDQFGKKVFSKFTANLSGYGKSTSLPWKIYVEDKNYVRIRKGIDQKEDKLSLDIYTSGLNAFLHFHKISIFEGFSAYFDYGIRNKNDPYVILNMHWNTKFRKIFQNGCIFQKQLQLRTYNSEKHRSINEVKIEPADENGVLNHQKIIEIKHHDSKCYEIEIPLGTKIIVDNHLFSPIEIDSENREEVEEKSIDFQLIRKKITSKTTDMYEQIPKTIQEIISEKYTNFSLVAKIIEQVTPRSINTKHGDKTLFEGVIVDDSSEIKFSVWTKMKLSKKNNYKGMYLYLPFATTKNGIITNKFNKEIKILNEALEEIC